MLEEDATIQCAYCGQSFTLAIDTSIANQQFTIDCEICCRPLEARITCEAGEVVAIDVASA